MVMMTGAKQEDTPKVSDTETKALKVNYISSFWCKVTCAVKFIALYVLSAKYLTPAHVIQRRQRRMYYTDSAGNIPIKPTLKERFMDLFKTDEKRKAELLKWANSRISPLSVFDFSTSWQDGIALCSLLESVKPGLCPGYKHLEHHNMVNNCRLGLRLAQQCLNVPQNMISPEEMAIGDVKAELKLFYLISIIKCLSEKKDLEISTPQDVQPQCSIRGSGVNTGVIGKKSRFTVFLSDIFGILDLSVHIKGPQNEMYSEKIINLLQAGEAATSPTGNNKEGSKNAKEVIGYIEDGCGNKFVRLEDGRHITATAKLNTIVFTCQSSGKGSFLMSYIPVSAGIHTISIRLLNNHVGGSPFKAKIYQPSDLNRKSMKEGMGKRFLFESLSIGSLEDVAQDMLKESGGVVAQIGNKDDNPKQKKLRRQYTIKNKRVLRKVITKNGEEIVVHDSSSPSLSRETSINTDSDVADSEDNKSPSKSTSKSIQKTKETCTNRHARVKAMDSLNDAENRHFNNSSQNTKELQDATRNLFKLGTNKSNNGSKNELSVEENQRLFKDKFLFCKIPLTDERNNPEANEQKRCRQPESKLSKAFTESVMLLKKKYELIDEVDKNPECVDDILRKEKDVFEMNKEKDVFELSKETIDITQNSSASEEVVQTGSIGVDISKKNDVTSVTNNEKTDSSPSDSLFKETQKLKVITSESMSKSCCYMINCNEKKTRNSINSYEENGSDPKNTDHEKGDLDYINSLPERNLTEEEQMENCANRENLFALTKRWQSFDMDTETDLMQIRKIFRMEDKLFGREGLREGNMNIGQNDRETHQSHQEYADLTSKDRDCCPENETYLQATGTDAPIHHQTDSSEMSIVGTGEIDIVKSQQQTHLKQEYSTALNMTKKVQEGNSNLPDTDKKLELESDQVLRKPNAYSPQQQDAVACSERNVTNEKCDEISGLSINEISDLATGLENDNKTLQCQPEIGQSQSKLPMIAFRTISSFESAFDGKILTPKPHTEKYTQVTSDEIIEETGWKSYSSMISIQRRKVNINVPSSFDKLDLNDINSQGPEHCNLHRYKTTSPEVEHILKNKTKSSTLQSDIQKWLQSTLIHDAQENQVQRVGRQSTIDTIDSGIMEELPKKPSRNISFSNESLSPVRMHQNGHRPTYCSRNRGDKFLNPELVQRTSTNTVISEPHSFYSELKVRSSKSQDGSDIPEFSPTVHLTTRKYLRFLPRDQSFSFSDSETKNVSSNCEDYKTVVERSFEDSVCKSVYDNSKDLLIPCAKRLDNVDYSVSMDSTRKQNIKVKDSKEKLVSADIENTLLRLDSPDCKLKQKNESESFDDNYFGFGVSKMDRSALLNQLDAFKQLSSQDFIVNRMENLQKSSTWTSVSHVPTITSNESDDFRSVFSSKSVDKSSDSIATRYVSVLYHEIVPTLKQQTSQINCGEIQNPVTYNFDVSADYFNVCEPFESEDLDNAFEADGLGLCSGQVGCKNNFQVWAKTTMNGCPTVGIIGPRPHCVTEICVVYTGDNLYEVMYEVSHPGFYIIVVKWADMEISDSPFVCKISY